MTDKEATLNKPPSIAPLSGISQLAEDIEPTYVPVVNNNYLPEGIVRLEGYVPPINGGVPWDANVQTQKVTLEGIPAGPAAPLESGPTDENDWVDPTPIEPTDPDPTDPEAPIDQTAPTEQTAPDDDNTSGLPVAPSTSDTNTTESSPNQNDEKYF